MVSGFCLSGMNFGIDPELCNFVALVMKFAQRSLVEKKESSTAWWWWRRAEVKDSHTVGG
jgi:hypothetical protein